MLKLFLSLFFVLAVFAISHNMTPAASHKNFEDTAENLFGTNALYQEQHPLYNRTIDIGESSLPFSSRNMSLAEFNLEL